MITFIICINLQIKIYAVKEYDGESLQFINTHYFHSKTEGDKHYDAIVRIFYYLCVIKPSIMNAMICLSIMYLIPKCILILQKLSSLQAKETEKFLTEFLKDKDKSLIL